MIPVYKYEVEDKICDKVQASASIAYTSEVKNVHINTNQLLKLKQFLESSTANANPNQFDLYYLESILASVGWNHNDDVFDRAEVWNARSTPVDKPFNYMHNETDIIGHLTSSKAVDFEGNIISNDITLQELPTQFDIVVGSVLYKKWADSKLQERIDKIIAEIIDNKWCVSMECLFRNFDYAIKYEKDGAEIQKILARSDDTSFLTKHLRIYGGTGEYSGYRIGRLLRNFTFSGKGLVDNPANPRSHITSFNESGEKSSFVAAAATMQELNISKEEKIMANEVVYTKEQYDALKAELDQFKTASQQAAQKEVDGLKAQIDELTKTNKTLSTELEASKEVSEAKAQKVTALETELSEITEKLAKAEESIKESEMKAINASRRALLLDRVDAEKAEVLVQKFANASQEMFDALVDSLPQKSDSAEKNKKKDDKMEEEEEESDAEVNTDIDDAKAEDNVNMSSGSTQEEETIRSKAANWFSTNVLRTMNKKQEGEI